MVTEFKKWLSENENRFSEMGLSALDTYEKYTDQKCDSIVITYESSAYICDINVQDNGCINIEVLSQKSGDIVFCIYCMTKRNIDISIIMNSFIDFIKINPA